MKLVAAARFCHRLATGLHAGVDLLNLLQSEASHGSSQQRQAMQLLADGARRGEQLNRIMKQDPFFPPLMVAMTQLGEETGRLERTLFTLSAHYERQVQLRKSFISSLTYPALQLIGAILVISLLIYIMGILTAVGGGQMTDILGFGLRGGSGVLWFWAYIFMFFLPLAVMVWAFAYNIAGIQNIVPLVYMIPVVGPAIQTITIARFCAAMALALDAGLDPIRSIRLSLDSTGSEYYQSAAEDAKRAIEDGATLAGGLQATSIFPQDFIQRVDIAEQSGTDAESMNYLAREYDDRAKTAVSVLSGAATVVIRVSVVLFVLFLIFRLLSSYVGGLNDAMAPI